MTENNSKSNFDKVINFNRSFGVPVFTEEQKEIFDKNPELVKLRLSLIQEEVKETVQNYERLSNEGKSPYDSPDYRRADDGVNWVVFNKSTGKILKSINYTPAKFD